MKPILDLADNYLKRAVIDKNALIQIPYFDVLACKPDKRDKCSRAVEEYLRSFDIKSTKCRERQL